MSNVLRPRLRPIESFSLGRAGGEAMFGLRDPEGFSGAIALPQAAALLAVLMDGERSLAEIQQEFHQRSGQQVPLADLEDLTRQLDQRYFLENDRFRAYWKREIEIYLNSPERPAAHAGGAYAAEPEALRRQLDALFVHPSGPGALGTGAVNTVDAVGTAAAGSAEGQLLGVLSPHIDLHRGGPAFAWAYQRIVEQSDADLFIIFGTAHSWMRHLFSVSKKHFATPLGTVETDKQFIGRLASRLAAMPGGRDLDLYASELAHRHEHSIEFQVVFLQHLLGNRRPFKVVPILTGSFHEFVKAGQQPREAPTVTAFVEACRATVAESKAKVCYISGGDLAHIGRRFGDPGLLDRARLEAQKQSDERLLGAACRADAAGFFAHVAGEQDRNRICGLSPTYTMLQVMQPTSGTCLKYDQAVEPDGSSCVSFASVAFYGR